MADWQQKCNTDDPPFISSLKTTHGSSTDAALPITVRLCALEGQLAILYGFRFRTFLLFNHSLGEILAIELIRSPVTGCIVIAFVIRDS